MAKFVYRAKQGPSQIINGVIEAEHRESAIRKISQLGYFPLEVSIKQDVLSKSKSLNTPIQLNFNFNKTISGKQIALFTRQLYILVDSGVPLLRALRIISNQPYEPQVKAVMSELADAIEDGDSFSKALAKHKKNFSQMYINMVRSGELSGKLPLVLNRLADFTLKEQETRSKVKASLYYPAFVLGIGVITVFILLTFVIPHLTQIFEDLNESLPLPTMILIGMSDFFVHFGWLLAAGIGGIFFLYKRIHRNKKGRLAIDRLKLKLPILGSFLREVEFGRFSRTLATLIKSGVTIVSALETVSEVLENTVLQQELRKVTLSVKNGENLTKALAQLTYFPESAISIIAVGEESGHLDHGLDNLADSYEQQIQLATQTVTSLLGPSMIVLIGMVVAFIIFALALPIFRMDTLIR